MNEARYQITKARAVILKPPNRPNGIEIGWLSDSGRTFHCKRIPQKHFHRKSKSYGFSYDWVRGGEFHNVIVHLISSGEELYTTRQVILRRGFILHFKSYEKQILLRLSDFGRARAREIELEIAEEQSHKEPEPRTEQLGLFENAIADESEAAKPVERYENKRKSGASRSVEVRNLWHE